MHAYSSLTKSVSPTLSRLSLSALALTFAASENRNIVANAVLIDVPGCNCDASRCAPFISDGRRRSESPDVCVFAKEFEDVVTQQQQQQQTSSSSSSTICNALESTPEFIDTYGTGVMSPYSDYYSYSREIPVSLRSGTCEQAYEYQNSCNASEEDGVFSGIAFIATSGRGCGTSRTELPGTGTNVRITANCASSYSFLTEASENELLVFVETEDGGSLCGNSETDVRLKYPPKLTSEDWIEPVPGRRYMCYEFRDPNDTDEMYSVLFMSVGNAPCDAPELKAEEEEDSPTTENYSPLGDDPTSAARHELDLNGYGYYFASMMMFMAVSLCF